MTARVAALYRHPVKGFTPEACDALRLRDDGRIEGDRVLGFRFANAAAKDDEWGTKHEFVALVNTPGLARLNVTFDIEGQRLRIEGQGWLLADERLDPGGRKRLAEAVQAYVLGLPENPLAGHPERLPIRLVGDGAAPRYQDSAADFLTLHGRASLAAFAAASGVKEVDERRFRSNVAVEGLGAWEEQGWAGRRVRIGPVELEFVRPKTRCLATHANPRTGERDLPVMKTLLGAYAAEKPTFAVALAARGGGGEIRAGDEVRLAG